MLRQLRRHSKSAIIYVLFGIIIVVFVFTFNVGSPEGGCGGGGREMTLAKVGDSKIGMSIVNMGLYLSADPPPPYHNDLKAFQQEFLYKNTRFYRLPGDGKYRRFIPDEKEIKNIKVAKVMDDLIETYLMSEEAMALGLRVSDKEVLERILNLFEKQKGEDIREEYENYVRYGLKTTLPVFEEFVRREILREKLIGFIMTQVMTTDEDAEFFYKNSHERVNFEYIELNPSLIEPIITVSDEDINRTINEKGKEIEKYYNEKKEEFQIPEKFKLYGIYIKAPVKKEIEKEKEDERKKELISEWDNARKKIDEINKEILGVPPEERLKKFKEIAKEKSAHQESKNNEGLLGEALTQVELSVFPFEENVGKVIQNTPQGEVSEIVEISDGFWIFYVENKTPAKILPFEEVKEAIGKKLIINERSPSKFQEISNEVLQYALSKKTIPLREAMEGLKKEKGWENFEIKVDETGFFSRFPENIYLLSQWQYGDIPGIGNSPEIYSLSFDIKEQDPIPPKLFTLKGSDSVYIVRLLKKETPGEISPEDRKKIKEEIQNFKEISTYRAWFRSLMNNALQQGKVVITDNFTHLVLEEQKEIEEELKNRMKKVKVPL